MTTISLFIQIYACIKMDHLKRDFIGIHFSNRNTYKFDDISQELYVKHPTNNVAELTAILTAINRVKHTNNKIIIYTQQILYHVY